MKVGILGYGNLGRGVESAIRQNDDMELTCIITRRDPKSITPATEGVKVYSVDEIEDLKDQIDVLVLCGGSATDLPKQTPEYAKYFNVIDSFDTHARIPEHFAAVDKVAKENGHVALISCGWDPGMFSLMRLYGASVLPEGQDYTFWGKGVSQGHSDAIRRVAGRECFRGGSCRQESETLHTRKTYQRMFCRTGRRGRSCKNRRRDQDDAKLFCRL